MKSTILLITLSLFALTSLAVDETIEPELKYKLIINGKEYAVSTVTSTLIEGDFSNPTIRLVSEKYRLFDYGKIQFKYPARMTWEADLRDEKSRSWTLTGNDVTVMYAITPHDMSLDEWADNFADRFGKERVLITQTKLMLSGKEYEGRNLLVKMFGESMRLEVYTLPTESGSRVLTIQDGRQDKRAKSLEYETVVNMLSHSFVDKMKFNQRIQSIADSDRSE
jgi:hypothetical protein